MTTILNELVQLSNKIENRMKHSEYRLKQAQAIAHIGSWELDFSTGIAEWSEEACRIYGLEPDDNMQSYESWISFIHPDDLEYVSNLTKQGMENLENFHYNHRIVRPDGIVRYVFTKGQFEFDEQGRPTYLHGISHDVTESKEAEMALAQSEANLRLIVDLIPQSIFAKGGDGKFIFVNKSFAESYGFTPDEMLTRSVADIIPVKEEAEKFLKQDQEIISSGETKVLRERVFTDHRGNKRLYDTIKLPFTPMGSDEVAVLGIGTDITEQRQAEKERAKMIGEIVQRNKMLEEYTYIVSHNLRAPVANIMGLTEVLQMPGLGEKEENEFIGALNGAVNKLNDIVLDLNEILQVEHKENKKKELVQFSDIIADIELSFEKLFRSEGVSIIKNLSGASEITTVKNYLYSILSNLISNSVKFRRPDVAPLIEISTSIHDGHIRITYKDNGLGVDLAKNGSKVFGLYQRFHPNTEGKGMGLFMVKTQVELLGGQVSIDSEINKGTEFIIGFEMN